MPHFLVSKYVLVKLHSSENNRKFAVGWNSQFSQGWVWASGRSDSGLYVSAKIVQSEIILGDMILELPGAIMWSQREKPTVWKRANSWGETKFWWHHWTSESNHIWSQDSFCPSQLSESIIFFLLLKFVWTGVSVQFNSVGFWVHLNNWTMRSHSNSPN